jgi:regulator of sigma E protease
MSIFIEIINILFWFVVILIPLVVIHEFGHLIMARLAGVKVIEFGVGIPPRVAHRKWKGIIWSINWVLLGGFAKIYGDHDALDEANEQNKINPRLAKEQYVENRLGELVSNHELQFFLKENNLHYDESWKDFDESKFLSSTDLKFEKATHEEYLKKQKTLETLISWEFDNKLATPEAFYNKNLFQKTIILMGGILFNLATAVIIFFLFYGIIGSPLTFIPLDQQDEAAQKYDITYLNNNVQVLSLSQDGAAYAAGIRPGDYIESVSGQPLSELSNFEEFKNLIEQNRGEAVSVVYITQETGKRESKSLSLEVEGSKSLFGVSPQNIGFSGTVKSKSIQDAFVIAIQDTYKTLIENFKILGRIVSSPFTGDKEAVEQVGGPVLVGKLGNQIYDLQGAKGIFNAMAFISVSLAAFNLLPLPALDGGRWVIIALSTLFGKRNKRLEGSIISVTMIALLTLGVIIAFKDIRAVF